MKERDRFWEAFEEVGETVVWSAIVFAAVVVGYVLGAGL